MNSLQILKDQFQRDLNTLLYPPQNPPASFKIRSNYAVKRVIGELVFGGLALRALCKGNYVDTALILVLIHDCTHLSINQERIEEEGEGALITIAKAVQSYFYREHPYANQAKARANNTLLKVVWVPLFIRSLEKNNQK